MEDEVTSFGLCKTRIEIGAYPFENLSVQNVPFILSAHDGANAWAAHHQPFRLKDFQRFANNRAADAVFFAEIVFTRQVRPLGEFSRKDVRGDGLSDRQADARSG